MQHELVSAAEAADLLGVSPDQLRGMVKRGIIRPDPSSPSTVTRRLFRITDLSTLKEIRSKGYSLETAIVESRRSSFEALSLRRELDRVKFLLGLDIPTIGVGRDELISILLKAEDALRDPPTDRHVVLDWARILHALSETHFEAITYYTDNQEPWRAFLALGRKLCLAQDHQQTRYDMELHNIYMLLNAGLRRARQAAFFHVRTLYGKKNATEWFPEAKGCIHEDVIAMSFNNVLWEAPDVSPDTSSPHTMQPAAPEYSLGSGQ